MGVIFKHLSPPPHNIYLLFIFFVYPLTWPCGSVQQHSKIKRNDNDNYICFANWNSKERIYYFIWQNHKAIICALFGHLTRRGRLRPFAWPGQFTRNARGEATIQIWTTWFRLVWKLSLQFTSRKHSSRSS